LATEFNKQWFSNTFKGGKTNSITGDKGGGKSHLAVWIMYILITLGFEVYTNILFKKCVSIDEHGRKRFVEFYPPNIHKVISLTELIKKICQNLKDNPYQASVFFWDEMQNSLSAYDWNTEMFRAIIKFFSISRKFGLDDYKKNTAGGLCVTVMSPSFYRGIPKAIREELDAAFLKDEELYDLFMRYYPDGDPVDLKEIVFYKKGRRNILNPKSIGEILGVGTCQLCDERSCNVGDIVFAQKGFSFLEFGKFDNGKRMDLKAFADFLSFSSKIIPDDLPSEILEYLKGENIAKKDRKNTTKDLIKTEFFNDTKLSLRGLSKKYKTSYQNVCNIHADFLRENENLTTN